MMSGEDSLQQIDAASAAGAGAAANDDPHSHARTQPHSRSASSSNAGAAPGHAAMLSVVAAATAAAAAAAAGEAGSPPGHAHHQMNAPPLPHKPASVPSFRRALQSIRASDLAQEATLYAHHIAAEDSFWLKQEERFHLCLTRAQVGANSSRDLHAYLRRSSKLLQSVSESLASLGSFGVQGETGTMRVACMSVDIVRKSTGSYLGELNARVFGESLSRAAESLEAADQVYRHLSEVGSESLRALKAQRKATQDAWLAYIAQGQERHKCEQMGKPLKTDPFLVCRAYEHELYTLQTLESKFASLMSALLKDLEASESKRMLATKATLLDNLLAQKAVLEHTVKFTDNALQTVRAIDPAADIREFTFAADLYLPPNATAVSNASENPAALAAADAASAVSAAPGSGVASSDVRALRAHSQTEQAASDLAKETPVVAFLQAAPVRDPYALARVYAHEIEKEGSLLRQGTVFKSNWKACHAVVTASGFLHLFADKAPKSSPRSSLFLGDASVENLEGCVIQLRFASKGGLFSSPTILQFKAENPDQQAEWSVHMQKHQAAASGAQSPSGGGSSPPPMAVAAAGTAAAAAAAGAEPQPASPRSPAAYAVEPSAAAAAPAAPGNVSRKSSSVA